MSSSKRALLRVAGAFAFVVVVGGRAEASSIPFTNGVNEGFGKGGSGATYSPDLLPLESGVDMGTFDQTFDDTFDLTSNLKDADDPLPAAFDTLPSNENQEFGAATVSLDDVGAEAAAAVPEPATLVLLGLGLTGLSLALRRR